MARKDYDTEAVAAGFGDTDGRIGYLAGRRGESIVCMPEHFTGKRRDRWMDGFIAGKNAAESERVARYVIVCWRDPASGDMETSILKGWSVSRGKYLTQLQKKGIGGDVDFIYYEGRNKVRSCNCGI